MTENDQRKVGLQDFYFWKQSWAPPAASSQCMSVRICLSLVILWVNTAVYDEEPSSEAQSVSTH